MIHTVAFKFDSEDEAALAAELGLEMDAYYQSIVHMEDFIRKVVRVNLDHLKKEHGIGQVSIKVKVRKRKG